MRSGFDKFLKAKLVAANLEERDYAVLESVLY